MAVASVAKDASNYIPAAPILLPEGPWQQVSNSFSKGPVFFVLLIVELMYTFYSNEMR